MTSLLSTLQRYLSSRLGYTVIGLFAIASLIWVVGPRIGLDSTVVRIEVIIALFALVLVFFLLKWVWIKRRGNKLEQQLQAQEESLAGRQLEIELLKEKMQEAVAQIKSSELGVSYRGSAALYALPWYMIIGPSASGKSTLLRNSGLHFPFSSQEDLRVKGFGGTRNCDWWFADEAVLLDTAGRYTTEDQDQEEWLSFLQLLKKNRPRLPINGIVVTVSMLDLLTGDDEGISFHVKVIRERVEELYNKLGFVFPVYLVFTKCDLIKGFSAYFADLNERERAQIWGIDLFSKSTNLLAGFTQGFDQLQHKLTQLQLGKLAIERHMQRKIEIVDFPTQFNAARARLVKFCELLFKDNPYQETPNFCGAYFTSGTQEGLSIQRLLGELKQSFSFVDDEEQTDHQQADKSFFIHQLFQEVIFKYNRLAARTKQRLRMQLWLKSASSVVAMAVIVLGFFMYSTSFTANLWLLHQGESVATSLAVAYKGKQQPSPTKVLVAAGNFYQQLKDYQRMIPFHLRLGLYRGDDQLPIIGRLFDLAMAKYFLQPVDQQLVSKLQRLHQHWQHSADKAQEKMRGEYYQTLKDYLALRFPNHLSVSDSAQAYADDWQSLLQKNHDNQLFEFASSDLTTSVAAYLTDLKRSTSQLNTINKPYHEDLVRRARNDLRTATNANNLYAELVSNGAAKLQPLYLHDFVSGYGANLLISNQDVSGIYTKKGWNSYVKPQIDRLVQRAGQGDWVMDVPVTQLAKPEFGNTHQVKLTTAQQEYLQQQIRELYFMDYAHAWLNLMANVRVQQFHSLDDAAKQLSVLASTDGPVIQFFRGVMINTEIADANNALTPDLQTAFSQLQHLIKPSPTGTVNKQLLAYLQQLQQVQGDVLRLTASSNVERDVASYASQLLSGQGNNLQLYQTSVAIYRLTNPIDAVATRQALNQFLLQPLRETWRSMLAQATVGLQQQWQVAVYHDFEARLAGKFPLTGTANTDATIDAVNQFFKPQAGQFWGFVNNELAPYLVQTGNGWQEQQWLGIGAPFSKQFLSALTQAQAVTDSLFAGGNNQMGFDLQVYPIPTPGVSEIRFGIDGRRYVYTNGPQSWFRFSWSPSANEQMSYLTAVTATGMSPPSLHQDGPWGLLHLLQRASLVQLANGHYRLMWQMHSNGHDYPVRLLIRTDPGNELLNHLLTKNFNLPSSIFQRDIVMS